MWVRVVAGTRREGVTGMLLRVTLGLLDRRTRVGRAVGEKADVRGTGKETYKVSDTTSAAETPTQHGVGMNVTTATTAIGAGAGAVEMTVEGDSRVLVSP